MNLANSYLWLKALHISFMVTWFAGLFYLPRLFIYHSRADDAVSLERFNVMERRLMAIMTVGAGLTAIFGLLLLWTNPVLLKQLWFQLKLGLLVAMIFYHWRCYCWIKILRANPADANTRWLRWFNEIPVVFLLGIICLAIVKPT